MNLKKELSGVAEAVAKVMEAELSPKQKAIAKLAEPKHKIDSADLAKLRAGHKPVKEDTVDEGYYKDIDTNRKEDERLAAQKKKQAPFTPDKPAKKVATAGKFGYGYSAARHLARQGMASLTKEEQEFIDELNKGTLGSYVNAAARDAVHRTAKEVETGRLDKLADKRMKGIKLATKKLAKEETEQVDEAVTKTATGYIHHARPGVYGGSEKEKHVVDTLRGPKKSEIEAIEKEKKMKKFSEMLDLINSQGLKALSEMIKEEPDNETFTKELKDQQDKSEGKKKQPDLAKGSVQAVKVEEEMKLDEALPPGVTPPPKRTSAPKVTGVPQNSMKTKQVGTTTTSHGTPAPITKRVAEEAEQVEERSLTEPEMKKKEEIVKSMKKGLAGFKARYGDRAKEVMYATATKQAKGE